MISYSTANSLKAFIAKLGRVKAGDERTVKNVIYSAFAVEENSQEAELLIYAQADNFQRLLTQIELSAIEGDAKDSYKKQVQELSKLIKHPAFYGRFEAAQKQIIDPNLSVLTYLNDALKLSLEIDDNAKGEIEKIAAYLHVARDELLESSLPLKLKSVLYTQISQLIFLLKNYEAVGIDKVWEVAAASYTTAQRDAPKAADEDEKGKAAFRKFAVGVAALVGVLAAADSGIDHAVNIANRFKGGYELIEQWQRDQIPKIEHKNIRADDKSKEQ